MSYRIRSLPLAPPTQAYLPECVKDGYCELRVDGVSSPPNYLFFGTSRRRGGLSSTTPQVLPFAFVCSRSGAPTNPFFPSPLWVLSTRRSFPVGLDMAFGPPAPPFPPLLPPRREGVGKVVGGISLL